MFTLTPVSGPTTATQPSSSNVNNRNWSELRQNDTTTKSPSSTPYYVNTSANEPRFSQPITNAMAPNVLMPLDKFSCFDKLPAELRVMIWNLSLQPRMVEVRFERDGRRMVHKLVAAFPKILHVSQEARAEGLKRYKLAFASKWALNQVYFDFSSDILYLSHYSEFKQSAYFIGRIPKADRDNVQRLASYMDEHPYRFPNLKEWICLVGIHVPHSHHVDLECGSQGLDFYDIQEQIARFSSPDLEYYQTRFNKDKALHGEDLQQMAQIYNTATAEPITRYGSLCEQTKKASFI